MRRAISAAGMKRHIVVSVIIRVYLARIFKEKALDGAWHPMFKTLLQWMKNIYILSDFYRFFTGIQHNINEYIEALNMASHHAYDFS